MQKLCGVCRRFILCDVCARSDNMFPESAAPRQNQPLQTVRMGVVEGTQQTWNSILEGYKTGQNWQLVSDVQHRFRLSVVDFARLFCPFISTRSFCATDAPLVDTRVFSYGWKIYSLKVLK